VGPLSGSENESDGDIKAEERKGAHGVIESESRFFGVHSVPDLLRRVSREEILSIRKVIPRDQ